MRKIIFYLMILLCGANSVFAQPGTLDPTFGTGGKVIVPQISGYNIEQSLAMAIQADGKIVMTHYAYNTTTSKYCIGVSRLNTDGSLDNSFSGDGRAFAEFSASQGGYPYDIALAPDGKIVVTGYEYHYNSPNYYYSMTAVRFNTDGSLDNSFDGDGFVFIDENINAYDLSFAVDVQQDGKILLTGRAINPQTGQYDFKVVRLNTNGTLDNSFDGDGRAFIDFSNNYEEAWKIKVQGDGKIIVAGFAYNNTNNYYDFAIARLNTDGSLDNGFGTGGKAMVDVGGYYDYAYGLDLQANGKIVVGGLVSSSNDAYGIIRLNTNGSLDNSFDGDGRKIIDLSTSSDVCWSVAVQSDGRILMNGYTYNGTNYDFGIVRLNEDGSFDNSFDGDGKLLLDFSNNSYDLGRGLGLQQDGKIVINGYSSGSNGYGPAAARLLNDVLTYTLSCPGNQLVNATNGQCTAIVNGIDPVLTPTGNFSLVNYMLSGATTGSGTGTVSGMSFNYGTTTVTYTLASDPTKTCSFTITVNAGTDTDNDGIPNACDPDDDNDGIPDGSDCAPLNPSQLVASSSVTYGTPGPPNSVVFNSPADYTFSSGGTGVGNTGGRTWFFNNINDASYAGLWWTFNPIANPRHSSQAANGNMSFSNYNPVTGIATFTSTANMLWSANSGVENIQTRLRIQFQPYTGIHNNTPLGSGWVDPVTAGIINLNSLASGHPLIDIKAIAGIKKFQVWFILEEVNTGTPLNVYFATYPHTSTVGGTIVTSVSGNFFGSTVLNSPATSTTLNSPADYTFSSGGTGVGNTGGRTWFFNNINDAPYTGLWWTFNPLANPRHSSQGATGNMAFTSYNPATGIATFTSTANMLWSANSGVENIQTRLRIQFQPYTGIHNNTPLGSGWVDPITAGIINLNSLASGHPLIDIKAIAGIKKFQVWFILEEVITGTPLNVYYATYPHTSTGGGTVVTSVSGNFFSTSASVCNGGTGAVTITATGGTAPYSGTGTFVLPPGSYNYVVTDAAGCTTNVPFTVVAQVDVTDPVITCPGNISADAPLNSCSASVPFVATATDNCSATIKYYLNYNTPGVLEVSSGHVFAVGVYTVTAVATDPSGNDDDCSFTITVNDVTKPTFVCPSDQNVNLNGACQLVVPDLITGLTGSDNCGTVTFTQSPLASASLALSHNQTHNVVITASDGNGNTQTCTVVLTGKDVTKPTFACPGNENVNLNATCQLIVPNLIAELTGSDNCGTVTFTQSPIAGALLGSSHNQTHNVVITASDGNGNTQTCTVILTGKDVTQPTFNCPSNQNVNLNASCQLVVPNLIAGLTGNDNCGTVTFIQSPIAGSPLGSSHNQTHSILITASDGNGNTQTCTVVLTGKDVTQPTFNCPSNQNVNLNATCQLIVPNLIAGLTGNDNCGTVTFTQSPLAGAPLGSSHNQTHSILITASDGNGNTQTCTVVLTGKDVTSPTFSCPGNQNINLTATCQLIVPSLIAGLTGNDNCGTVTFTQSPVAGASLGSSHNQTHNVLITASDGNGNTQTCTVVLTGIDVTQPTFNCPSNQNVNLNGSCQLIVPNLIYGLTGNDNCGTVTFTQSPVAGASLGSSHNQTHSIVITANDGNGNTQTCTVILTGKDVTKPTFTCPYNRNVNLNGTCQLIVPNLLYGLTGNDNCGTVTFTQNPAAGVSYASSHNQTYNVVITANDGNGNTESCTVVLTAKDITLPVITCPSPKTISCDASILPANTGSATATDNCGGNPVITYSDVSGQDPNPSHAGYYNYTITRTWKATDVATNTSTCNQTITVQDITKPMITCPANKVNVPFDFEQLYATIAIGNATATDNCAANANIAIAGTRSDNVVITNQQYPLGQTTVAWSATDPSDNSDGCTQTITVRKRNTAVTYTGDMIDSKICVQYSDIINLQAKLTDNEGLPTPNNISGRTITFQLLSGTTVLSTKTATTNASGVAAQTFKIEQAPGLYSVKTIFAGDGYFNGSNDQDICEVKQEDAIVEYNGSQYFTTPSATSVNGSVTFAASINDIDDGIDKRGDIRKAKATFRDGGPAGNVLGSANLPVGLVTPGVLTNGLSATTQSYSLNTNEIGSGGKIFQVWVGASDHYKGADAGPTPVTLALPGQDFVTGGGHLVVTNSAGTYAGTLNSKMNFGFTLKWNKSGKNLQGNINIVFRKWQLYNGVMQWRVYQAKSNSINSMAVVEVGSNGQPVSGTNPAAFRKAIINTKANLKDVTDPLSNIDLGGNHNLTLDAWDHITANGGVSDKISVTLMGSTTNELLFSSSWISNATAAQTITGGNVNVRNGSSSSSTTVNNSITKSGQMEVAAKEDAFVVKAYPNPTEHEFTLIVNSSLNEKIEIQLYDAVGRKIQTLSANANETIRFGGKLKTGVYIAKVIQGNRKESIKLIKQ